MRHLAVGGLCAAALLSRGMAAAWTGRHGDLCLPVGGGSGGGSGGSIIRQRVAEGGAAAAGKSCRYDTAGVARAVVQQR